MSDLMPTPQPGFAPAPVNSTQWNSQVVQAAADAQQRATSDKRAQASQYQWIPSWIKTPVEWFGAKAHAAYTNVISRPLTTVGLAMYIGSAEANSNAESWSNLFDGDIWDRAWDDSKHVSPGQMLEFGIENFGGDLREAMTAPVIYKPKDMTGKQVVDRQGKPVEMNLNKKGYIWDNPDAVSVHFDEGIQKWVSGGLDAYISWYADPLYKAGQGIGIARNLAYVRPAIEAAERPRLGTILARKAGLMAEAGARSRVAENVESSAFTKMGDFIMRNKEKLGEDGFPEWVTNQNWAKNSGDSGAIAAALGAAKDRDQVNMVLSAAMGDANAAKAMGATNKTLEAQLNMLDRQKKGLISNAPQAVNPEQAAKLQLQLKTLSDDISGIERQQQGLAKFMAAENMMKNGMYFTPGISPLASNIGQFARGLTYAEKGNVLSQPFRAGMALAYNNLYVRPIRVLSGTSWRGIRAPGHIDIDASDSYMGFKASLQQAKVWTPEQVNSMTSSYINADRATKDFIVQQSDLKTVQAIAMKHGLSETEANAIYRELGGLKGQARDGRVYSTAYIDTADGGRLRADHVNDDGSLTAVAPVLNSQLQNTHILHDYEHMDRVLKMTAGPFKKLLAEKQIMDNAQQAALEALPGTIGAKALKTLEVGKDMSETMSKLWKFNVLLRMGYGPRAIADDFMGQVARMGAANFFIERTLMAGRNMSLRNWNKTLNDVTGFEARAAGIDSGIAMLSERVARHQSRLDRIESYIPGATRKRAGELAKSKASTQADLKADQDQLNYLREYRNKIGKTKNALGDNYIIMPDGTAFARPFEGPEGQLFKNLLSGRATIDSMMGGTAASMWNQFRKGDWRVRTEAEGADYISAYLRAAQGQIGSDKAAQAVLRGEKLTDWFGTAAGRAYRRESAMKNMSAEEHAERIEETVNHLLPVSDIPEIARIRQLVSEGASDADVAKAIKEAHTANAGKGLLPEVQSEGIAYNMGKSDFFDHVDGAIDKWYNLMNKLPSEVLSRNPLFFQLYRQHVSDLWQIGKEQGLTHLSPARQQEIEQDARKLALKDVKKLTFNMDHESKLAHSMRFIAPFFGPMQESFTRWGKIIADKPEILANARNIYTAPIRAGHTVDQDGNLVDQDGYVTLPDGSKKLVEKKDMHIQFQAPQWLAKSIGMDQGSIVDMPIDTLNLVLQNDPWYNPGTGPWVQLPANWVAQRADPSVGDTMTKLGILQQVTPEMSKQILGAGPSLIKTILGASDPDLQQRDMAYLMQSEDYKFKTGMRDKPPTWPEIKDRVEHAAYLRGWMKFVSPVSTGFKDPYQFFRDRYQELTKADPKTADQVFLAKYGDAAFAFTGALTYNRKHLPATVEAVRKDKAYSYITDADPDLAALVVNPTQGEPFSQTAYIQQMMSGDRKRVDAFDVMSKARENLGWAQYNKYMNIITARLYQAGFRSFSEKGAEEYANQRQNVIKNLTSTQINGKDNKNYNPDFAKAFLTIDRSADDRRADAMKKLVTESTIVNDPMRKDLHGLAQYMIYRDVVKTVLANRDKVGGSADINARQNKDVKRQFAAAVNGLTESNTMFQSLHERWLVHDMFDHHNPEGDH